MEMAPLGISRRDLFNRGVALHYLHYQDLYTIPVVEQNQPKTQELNLSEGLCYLAWSTVVPLLSRTEVVSE